MLLQLRSFWLYALFFITFFSIGAVDAVPAGRYAVQRRDDTTSTIPIISSASAANSAASPISNSGHASTATATSSIISSIASKSTAAASPLISSSISQSLPSTTIPNLISSTTLASSMETGLFNSTLTPDLLPISPKITPAFSIAGVLLMISGCIYAFIGIKSKLLQIGLSASYLTNLSITVLIIYVMNPPISNSIQGAYLVAIVVPGIVVGCGSMVFPDITEGLGCILGGFCFAMWLLVLTPGGLVQSTSGICIMIAVFCVASLATCATRYTRPYGLIVSISFAGATAVVLGIDCFSRAGLKEFWAWIWNLNSSLFPLGATTYPITRGMRVEIAAIFVIFLAGMATQMKLWQVIAKKNADRKSRRAQDEEIHEREEEDVGRRIEETSAPERDQWEAIYGDGEKIHPAKRGDPRRSIADSGVGDMDSPKKTPRSTITSLHRQSTDDGIEMADIGMAPGPKFSDSVMSLNGQDGGVTVRVAHDDRGEIGTIPEFEDDEQLETSDLQKARRSNDSFSGSWTGGPDGGARRAVPPKAVPGRKDKGAIGPEVVPLPFQVPSSRNSFSDDRSSVATYNDDDQSPEKPQRRSKRFSVGNPLKRLSRTAIRNSQRLSGVSLDGNWTKMSNSRNLDQPEFDRRSSIAATIDDISDQDDLESLPADMTVVLPLAKNSPSGSAGTENEKKLARPVSMSMIELQRNSLGLEKSSIKEEGNPRPRSVSLTETVATTILESSKAESVTALLESSKSEPQNLTEEVLPSSTPSKVVMSYRTNEWAKHLANADAPPIEKLQIGLSQRRVRDAEDEVEYAEQEDIDTEVPAPVDFYGLQQTATNATPSPAPRLRSREDSRSSVQAHRDPRSSSSMSQRRQGPPQTHHTQGRQRSSSAKQTVSRSGSALSMNAEFNKSNPKNRDSIRGRSTSSPSVPLYAHNTANASSTPNLLSQRQSLVKQKHSFMSLKPLASTPELEAIASGGSTPTTPGFSNGDSGSNYSQSVHEYEAYGREREISDDMSLRERKGLMLQRERESTVFGRGTPSPFGLDRYQQQYSAPSRSRSRQSSMGQTLAQRDAVMAAWRATVQEDLHGINRSSPVVANGKVTPAQSGRISAMEEREIDLRREQLFEDKKRKGFMTAAMKEEEMRRAVERDAMLRQATLNGRSSVEGAHREVMRRLQKKASNI